jgi:hypothetical protein
VAVHVCSWHTSANQRRRTNDSFPPSQPYHLLQQALPCVDGMAGGHLGNMLPAHRRVNQHLKCARLPSTAAVRQAHDAVLEWWRLVYIVTDNAALSRCSTMEAQSSLPAIETSGSAPDLEDVYAAVELQRLRLHQDQHVPEWDGDDPCDGAPMAFVTPWSTGCHGRLRHHMPRHLIARRTSAINVGGQRPCVGRSRSTNFLPDVACAKSTGG